MVSSKAILASSETEIADLALETHNPFNPETVPITLRTPLVVEAMMVTRPPNKPPSWSLRRLLTASKVWLICIPYLDWKTTTCVCTPVSGSVVMK